MELNPSVLIQMMNIWPQDLRTNPSKSYLFSLLR